MSVMTHEHIEGYLRQNRRSLIISPQPHYSQMANDGRYKLAAIDGYDVVRCWGKHISIVRGLGRGSVAK